MKFKALFFIICLTYLTASSSFACTDQMADAIVLNRVTEMAKRYSTTKVGIGHSLLWGDTRMTNVSIHEGVGGNDGVKVDRMGTILINMDTCVVKGKLIGTFDIIDVK
jgi:hypothetical protein